MHSLEALALMWTAMMAAMMLPAAAPMIRVCAGAALERNRTVAALGWIAAFVLGYLAVWTAYGIAAALLQWRLQLAGILAEGMVFRSTAVGGCILILAGLYQWTGLKHACLERCRSPLTFILLYWRNSAGGALRMGLRHGGYCVGCCWMLMLLLFVGGVMSLVWIALLAGLVLAERTLRRGPALARGVGLLMIAAGCYRVLGGERLLERVL